MMTESMAKPKAKGTSRASKPRKSATKSKSPGMRSRERATEKTAAGWRGQTMARMRALILEADPKVVEEVKWRKPSNSMLGVPVWSHNGIICTGETYKDKVKFTFAKGAS